MELIASESSELLSLLIQQVSIQTYCIPLFRANEQHSLIFVLMAQVAQVNGTSWSYGDSKFENFNI